MRALAATILLGTLALTACSDGGDGGDGGTQAAPDSSSGSVTASWEEPQDVLDGLAEAGFDCAWSGAGDQIIDESPISGEPAEVIVIRCDGYGVALGSGEDGWYSQILPECQPLTDNDRNSPLATAPIVLGSNVAFLGGDQAGQFPAEASAEQFVAAFGGEIITFLDLYDRVCGAE